MSFMAKHDISSRLVVLEAAMKGKPSDDLLIGEAFARGDIEKTHVGIGRRLQALEFNHNRL
jgi:hypothetical protein